MTDILARICEDKRHLVQRNQLSYSISALYQDALRASPVRPFGSILRQRSQLNQTTLIAEIKKASPSEGIIRKDFDPAALAKAYEAGGASCLSVLTDEAYFQGSEQHLLRARSACALPVLRKDFILDPYQVVESRAMGADCILLILAALEDEQAAELEAAAMELGMSVLAEVHDQGELERALEVLSTPLIGINNRNLKTLSIDLTTAETLAEQMPDHRITICESGIHTHSDIERMQKHGMFCFLVGTSLMRQADVAQATRQLLDLKT